MNYVLGGIIGGVIYNNSVKILDFIAILCIWCALVLGMKWIKVHNVKAKQLIDGKALLIISDGKIDTENCRRTGLSAHDVAFKVQNDILEVIGKDEQWLQAELEKQGIAKASDVFLGEYLGGCLVVTTYQ